MKTALLVAAGTLVAVASSAAAPDAIRADGDSLWVYVGTYAKTPDAGINFFRFDLGTGRATRPEVVAQAANPSFLALHPRMPVLYAIHEVPQWDRRPGGCVSAFTIAATSGRLARINQQPSEGAGPCHVSVDRGGGVVLVANYGGGSIASFPVQPNGGLAPVASVDKHHGSSVHPKRQTGPFAHCADVDPANRFVFSADLGTDKLMIYRLDPKAGTIAPHQPAAVATSPGAGPRHLAFHPGGRFLYVINELANTVSLLRYDADRGSATIAQEVPTLPADFRGANTTAEVQVHPSGRFLYGSNRGHDSLAIFSIDPQTGRLTAMGHEPTRGRTPRHFAIDPTGRYLFAANQDSGNIAVFRIDPRTGLLRATGESVAIPMPVCVVMRRPVE